MVGRMAALTIIVIFFISHSIHASALEISIGIGGAPTPPPDAPEPTSPCPPPPHPPRPPSPSYNMTELQILTSVITQFGKTITCDPQGIRKSWKGVVCMVPKTYKGFICDTRISDNTRTVALVNFNGFGFAGDPLVLNNFLEKLSPILVFHSNSNNFTGSVPNGIGINNLNSFLELDLSNNKLHGTFPTYVLSATNLTFLDLRFNRFTGPIDQRVFDLLLDVLFLNNNQFTGEIPYNLGATTALYLSLANNYLTGNIPKSIKQAANTLLEILLLNNQLSGCLPPQIGFLKKATLFDASCNKLTGPIPNSFACLKSMQYLNLASNKLYGTVPEQLCRVRSLISLDLTDNYFTQIGPDCKKLMMAGKLKLKKNCILYIGEQRDPKECNQFFNMKQTCPNLKEMSYIPCQIDGVEQSPVHRRLMALPRTYAALLTAPVQMNA